MARLIIPFLTIAALSGCATNNVSSLSSIGGNSLQPGSSEQPKAAETQPSPAGGSGLGSIWENFSSSFRSGEQPQTQKTADAPSDDNAAALQLINDYRAKKGLQPLTLDPKASAAADALAKDMAKHDRLSHVGPNGADVGKRLIAAGYSYRLAAENVGVGQTSLSAMIGGWEKSASHSKNMLLADAKNIGIGHEYKADTKFKNFWTLVIAAPQSS
jgi:uncharacterized protein YkwD